MGATAPLVSYIVVNWRTERYLKRALDSIYAQTHPHCEVILVDNASPDFDTASVTGYGGLKLLRNQANRGFAAANNQGVAMSSGEYVVLLNADAMLDRDYTAAALAVFGQDQHIGTVVPKILRDDLSGRIDSAGHVLYEDRTAAHIGKDELDQGQYGYAREVFGGTAAAIIYRRRMIDDIALDGQLFDESFFAYFEDVDVDWRANLAGWRAVYAPQCRAWHRGHGSGGRASKLIQLTAEKNRYLMLARNDTPAAQAGQLIPLAVYEAYHLLRTLLRPWVWPALGLFLWHLPQTVAQRAVLRRTPQAAQRTARLFLPRGLPAPAPRLMMPGDPAADAAGHAGRTSLVVLNFNGLHQTLQCLAALEAQSAQGLELIVVDNGSTDNEAAEIARRHPRCKVLRLARNHGFAGGVNWGLTLATGEHIVLVNNDCLLERECIERLVAALAGSHHTAVSGRLVDVTGPLAASQAFELATAIRAGATLPATTPPPVLQAVAESRRNHAYSIHGHIAHDAFGAALECSYPSGGLMAIRRRAIPEFPQLFPHHYFAYHEDAWLGFALRARGGTIGKEPSAVAVHQAGSTARRLGRARLKFLQERNRWLNLLGWLPGAALLRLAPLYLLTTLLTGVALLLRPADWLGWLAGQLWLLTHPLAVAKWRQRCQQAALVQPAELTRRLSGIFRGRGGIMNAISRWWCRVAGIATLETEEHMSQGARQYEHP